MTAFGQAHDLIANWMEAKNIPLKPDALGDLRTRIASAIRAALDAKQPHCGHPIACIVSSDENTHHCAWCMSLVEARRQEWKRHKAEDELEETLQVAIEIEEDIQ